MIADVVSYAIAGIGFIYAAGRLFVRKGFTTSINNDARLRQSAAPLVLGFYFPQIASGKPQRFFLREQVLKR